MKLKTAALGILFSFTCPVLWAQSPTPDPLAENLFPPELVMQHQSDIGLTEEQRNALIAEVQKAQERFSDLQQRLLKEVESLGALLKREQVEEQAALAQFDKVLNQEREIKRAHMELAIRIKNKLTQEQQTKLQSMRPPMGPGPDGPARGRPSGPDGPERGPGRGPGGPGGPPPGAGPRPPQGQPPEGLFPPERPLVP